MPCNAPPNLKKSTCCYLDLADIPQGDVVRIVAAYRKDCRPNLQKLLDYYAALGSLTAAIDQAGQGRDDRGQRHPHQRRLTHLGLDDFTRGLHRRIKEIRLAREFDELHQIIAEIGKPITGIGGLMIYDTALRIGAHLQIYPTRIYLHAGALKGAKKLSLPTSEKILPRSAFPKPLSRLKPHEIEDCLCIYKDNF